MELTIEREELLRGLDLAARAVNPKSPNVFAQNVLLEAELMQGLRIAATDLVIGIDGKVEASVGAGGSASVPAKMLHTIVKNLPGTEVKMKTDDNGFLRVQAGRSKFKLAAALGEDHVQPPVPPDGVEPVTVAAPTMVALFARTLYAASKDQGRPHLNGVLFEREDDTLRMVATDGQRMALAETQTDSEGGEDFSWLLPLGPAKELQRALPDDGDVHVITGSNTVFFSFPEGCSAAGFTLSAKLVEAKFPPYSKVIPKSFSRAVEVDREAFSDALKRAMLVAPGNKALRVAFGTNGEIQIASDDPEVGEGSETIDATFEGETAEMVVGFNGTYLAAATDALDICERIKLRGNGATDATALMPASEDSPGRILGIVMPMRL